MTRPTPHRCALLAPLIWATLASSCVAPRPPSLPLARPADPTPSEEPDSSDSMLKAHNARRARAGLPPFFPNPILDQAAAGHARDMADRRKMSHKGGDGSSPFDRIKRQGYSFRAAGENVAYGFDDVESVLSAWMRSPGHRRNILGPYSEIGVGRAIAKDGASYWCVTFGTPPGSLKSPGRGSPWVMIAPMVRRTVPPRVGLAPERIARPMRGLQWTLAASLLTMVASGCSGGPSKRTLAASEPPLSSNVGDPEVAIVDRAKPVATSDSAVDRHPLLSKPRDYYENTNSNKVAKTAAAAFIGVPVGIFGELKQIVVGAPATPGS